MASFFKTNSGLVKMSIKRQPLTKTQPLLCYSVTKRACKFLWFAKLSRQARLCCERDGKTALVKLNPFELNKGQLCERLRWSPKQRITQQNTVEFAQPSCFKHELRFFSPKLRHESQTFFFIIYIYIYISSVIHSLIKRICTIHVFMAPMLVSISKL